MVYPNLSRRDFCPAVKNTKYDELYVRVKINRYIYDEFKLPVASGEKYSPQSHTRLPYIADKDVRVEGLITRGAMKPDDRPLWFDIYKAFPPLAEPKFAKPQPEIKPIRPILYEEDAIRAKFHSAGQGLGVINMLSSTGETPIKKLVTQYNKLKAEGVPESELIEKASAAVDGQRQQDAPPAKPTFKNPESVTAQVMAEADLKNIFNEK